VDAKRSDWQQEREWRLVGDMRLQALPAGSLCVFVADARQAQTLSRHCRWPVIWLQDAQTLALPTGSKRRPRRGVGTSRN
jgi:hypothetical protein